MRTPARVTAFLFPFIAGLLGTKGANIPALLRAFVACGWFGIQTWIGGSAIYKILGVFRPCLTMGQPLPILGIPVAQFILLSRFLGINMWIIYLGIDCIRWLLNIKAPLLIALGLLLLWWAYRNAGGFGPILSQPSAFDPGQPKEGQFWHYFFPALTGMVGFWATLSLNIPDFSRYAKSQRDQVIGPALGYRRRWRSILYRRRGHFGDNHYFQETIWDPVDVLTRFTNPVVLVMAMLALCIATLATNIAANVVSPANDFAHLFPRKISFQVGGFITGIIGIVIMPWHLVANADRYINGWLIGYSALLGPIGGILIADYFVFRRRRLNVRALDSPKANIVSPTFSLVAITAFLLGFCRACPDFS